ERVGEERGSRRGGSPREDRGGTTRSRAIPLRPWGNTPCDRRRGGTPERACSEWPCGARACEDRTTKAREERGRRASAITGGFARRFRAPRCRLRFGSVPVPCA